MNEEKDMGTRIEVIEIIRALNKIIVIVDENMPPIYGDVDGQAMYNATLAMEALKRRATKAKEWLNLEHQIPDTCLDCKKFLRGDKCNPSFGHICDAKIQQIN